MNCMGTMIIMVIMRITNCNRYIFMNDIDGDADDNGDNTMMMLKMKVMIITIIIIINL